MAKMASQTQTTSSSADRTKQYAERVVSGEVIAGPHVRNACKRHIHDLEHGKDRGIYFD